MDSRCGQDDLHGCKGRCRRVPGGHGSYSHMYNTPFHCSCTLLSFPRDRCDTPRAHAGPQPRRHFWSCPELIPFTYHLLIPLSLQDMFPVKATVDGAAFSIEYKNTYKVQSPISRPCPPDSRLRVKSSCSEHAYCYVFFLISFAFADCDQQGRKHKVRARSARLVRLLCSLYFYIWIVY